ncbi:MAG: Fe-S cluster assembly ATPase SufC [Malacoplasma sp.]
MNKIKIKNLSVSINEKIILNDINFEINKGEVIGLIGPNGNGKSTLIKSIMKHYSTKIESGKIYVDNECINDLEPNEVAKKGIFLAPQTSEEIDGILMIDFLKSALNSLKDKKISLIELYKIINPALKDLEIDPSFLHRFVNFGFSGGEKKKSEILQMKLFDPQVAFLDEIDSGLDVDSLKIIVRELKKWLTPDKILVIVSHNEKLFQEIKPDKVCLILNGKIAEVGDYSLIEKVNREGYKWIKAK